ncbi:hypothetical protein DAI22_02g235950 [Oryza sativa Japonica Group]|nr:hypothetical protein DAI22_02g235950 [Oryza sativa Japonica Group]
MGHYLVGLPAHLPLQAQHGATPPLGPPSRRPFSRVTTSAAPAAAAAPLVASSILFFPPPPPPRDERRRRRRLAGWLPHSSHRRSISLLLNPLPRLAWIEEVHPVCSGFDCCVRGVLY